MGKQAAKLIIRNSATYNKLIAKLPIRGCRVILTNQRKEKIIRDINFLAMSSIYVDEISVSAMRIAFTFGSATIKFSSKQSASMKNMD
ncbi:hypothetical protein T07_622 [Trichinella nelsoni]|uniref:Uncharacterized protein n=1 Tax=Trichinella nelsoni TaxID=6336 RepID=A0A0V0S7U0_9BILA|nr:hypothetical protein T07_622 [Trichinella nelsoni]